MRLGSLGHDIYDSVMEIVNLIIENADSVVSANCDIPRDAKKAEYWRRVAESN